MEPNLLVGDRLFVTKYSYGYSKHSFPFSPKIFSGRIKFSEPQAGDVVVFKTPADNRTDYIKRLIGIPGDEIQFIDGNLYINNSQILKTKIKSGGKVYCGNEEMNVKFSKGPGAISKHKSEDIEKSMGRIKKTHIYFLWL